MAQDSYFYPMCSDLKKSVTMMTGFVGLNASNEELKLPKSNVWYFKTVEDFENELQSLNCTAEEAMISGIVAFLKIQYIMY